MTAFIALQVTGIVLAFLTTAAFWAKVAIRDDRFDKPLLRAVFVSSILCFVAMLFGGAFLVAAWANGSADMQVARVMMSVTMFSLLAALVLDIVAITLSVARELKAPSPAV